MSVVRGVGEVCDMCMCLARGGLGGVGVRGLGLGFTNPRGTCGKWDNVSVFWLRWCCVMSRFIVFMASVGICILC